VLSFTEYLRLVPLSVGPPAPLVGLLVKPLGFGKFSANLWAKGVTSREAKSRLVQSKIKFTSLTYYQ
jgi:hypothetical protein